MHVCKHKNSSRVSSTCLASFSLVWRTIVFNMLIAMSCFRPHSADDECYVWVVFAMYTYIALTHNVVCIVAQVSLQSFNDLSQVLRFLLAKSLNHTECFYLDGLRCLVIESCWVWVCRFMYAQVHLFTHLVILLKFCRRDHPSTTGHPLSCIAQFQLSVIMYCCIELHSAWGYLPGSMHCETLKSTRPTIT